MMFIRNMVNKCRMNEGSKPICHTKKLCVENYRETRQNDSTFPKRTVLEGCTL